MKLNEREHQALENICRACCSFSLQGVKVVPCENLECTVYYSKIVALDKVKQINAKLQEVINVISQ